MKKLKTKAIYSPDFEHSIDSFLFLDEGQAVGGFSFDKTAYQTQLIHMNRKCLMSGQATVIFCPESTDLNEICMELISD